ncbi:unnamed protein product [Nezara viridula]|uniref:Uncharacterized protein n=1 Tax=Nezara viridula TaxID=85310 RepID=A0A9P0MT70_NEZVI|nr:unnamed protein product [Nezara viridula]
MAGRTGSPVLVCLLDHARQSPFRFILLSISYHSSIYTYVRHDSSFKFAELHPLQTVSKVRVLAKLPKTDPKLFPFGPKSNFRPDLGYGGGHSPRSSPEVIRYDTSGVDVLR